MSKLNNKMSKIMFTGDNLTDKERQELLKSGYQVNAYGTNLSKEQIINIINKEKYNGYILGGDEVFDEETIKALNSSLKTISFYGVGYEAYIDTKACSEKGIVVTNTPRTNTNAVAEHTIALILAATRNIVFNNTNTKNGLWEKEKINDLSGLTVGIFGMGAIGSQVAKILHYSFDADIIYYNRSRKENLESELNMKFVSKEELFSNSDVITLHSSLNDETKDVVNNEAFNKMKKDIIIINTARAALIDPKALYENLKSGKVRTVAFDSFYKEPINLKEDKDFKRFSKFNDKQLIINPHTAYFSNQALEKMKNMAVQNVIDILENKSCDNVINELVDVTRKNDEYDSLFTEDYNFYIIEEKDYIDRIKNKIESEINPKHIETVNSFDQLLKLESINDSNKKIIMVYSDLLGEGEIVPIKDLENINNLKAICYGCTFLDKLDLEWCKKNNVIVTVLDDYRVEQRADLIFYIIQSLIGNISKLIKNPAENQLGMFPSIDLYNKKVGFIGYTDIAKKLIDKCRLFGMKISYYSEKYRAQDIEFNTLDNLLSTSDIIITCGYTKEEQYIIGRNEINKTNPNSYIISCEQGRQNVNKELFIQLAETNKIAGFGYTSSKDTMTDYKGNVFVIRDQTWGTDESYKKLCNSWIKSVKSVLNDNAKDITKL